MLRPIANRIVVARADTIMSSENHGGRVSTRPRGFVSGTGTVANGKGLL
jgi:hypothetical protein